MKMRSIATVMAILIGPLLLLGFPTSTDAGKQMIGDVTRTRASVEGALGGQLRDLQRDLPVFQNEEVRTGVDARAVLRFRDGSVLRIGANAEVVLDEYVYGNSGGVITLLKGALRFTSGKMGRPGLRIKLPVATIGIRGTDFWVGEMDGGYGVLLMRGVVDVSNGAGTVTLSKASQGTLISAADEAPSEPEFWEQGQQEKALAGVSILPGPICIVLQKVAKDRFRSCI